MRQALCVDDFIENIRPIRNGSVKDSIGGVTSERSIQVETSQR